MTTRRSTDLDLPPRQLEEVEVPLPRNVREFPLIIPPDAVLEMARRQRQRATEKAVARHLRRKSKRS